MARMTFPCAIFLLLVLLAACRKEDPAPAAQPQTASTTAAAATAEPEDMKNAKIDKVIPMPPPVVPQCEVGSLLRPDGAVAKPVSAFGPKDPITFSMWLKEAPAGLQVSVKIFDADDKEVAVVPKEATGLAIANLKLPALKPGRYTMEGYWGGNIVCEKAIEIRK